LVAHGGSFCRLSEPVLHSEPAPGILHPDIVIGATAAAAGAAFQAALVGYRDRFFLFLPAVNLGRAGVGAIFAAAGHAADFTDCFLYAKIRLFTNENTTIG